MGSIGATLPAPFGTAHFFDALHKKRQSLDHEIEQYKALKDEEYRRFESELRKLIRNQVVNEEATKGLNNGVKPLSPTQAENNEPGGRRNRGETMLGRLRSEENINAQKRENNDQPQVPAKSPEPVPDTPSHDREIEFQGLFTPRYLPLLEDSNRYSKKKTTPSFSPPSETPRDSPNGRGESTPPLSSSATLPMTRFSPLRSPLQSPKFSNSAPRPRLKDLRRTSSRSDTSLSSLRSSLKQPKSPRSSKHVLFAIDNNVLSPSSSPVLERSGKIPPISPSGLTDILASAGKVPNGTAKRASAKSTVKDEQDPQRSSVPEATSSFPSSPVKSYHHLVEPAIIASTDGTADFENISPDEETLFSFDEDANGGGGDTTEDDTVGSFPKGFMVCSAKCSIG